MSKVIKGFGTGAVFFLLLMFQIASGFAFLIVTGVIDAVMINELGVPAALVGLLLGIEFVAQPLRAYIGSLSDRYSVKGLHRMPFILAGGVILALTYPAMVFVVEKLRDPNYQKIVGEVHSTGNYPIDPFWFGLAVLVFIANGVGLAMMGTVSMSLIVDVTNEKVRGIVAAVSWSFLIGGIIIGSIAGKIILPDTQGRTFVYSSLYPIFCFIVPAAILIMVGMTCVGALLREPRVYGPLKREQTHATFGQAVRVITHNSQTLWFFLFIFTMMTFMFMRDIIAPAFAGNVFEMSLNDRAGIQSVVNGPLLIAMIVTGLLTLKFSKKIACYAGLGLAAVGMGIQAFAAFSFNVSQSAIQAYETASQQIANGQIDQATYNAATTVWKSSILGTQNIFTIGLIVMGIGLGVAVPGLIGMMMDLTDPANAALYMGTWGLAQALGQNLSSFIAGGARDVVYNTFTSNLHTGYGLLFILQAAGMGLTMYILTRVEVTKFRQSLASTPQRSIEQLQPEVVGVV